MISADYIIVGSGLTGATIARVLSDAGREVVVLERRSRIGGNVADSVHSSGIRMGDFGPHYFRTDSDRIWEYARCFSDFYKYEPSIMSWIDGKYEHWPIQQEYMNRVCECKPGYAVWLPEPEPNTAAENFEEACLGYMPKVVYEKAVKSYSEKMWGVPCTQLDADLAKRFDIRTDGDTRLKRSKYQGIPRGGYSQWMTNMLKGVDVRLGVDYLQCDIRFNECMCAGKGSNDITVKPKKLVVFTGPIDEAFAFDLGNLKYRGQKRVNHYYTKSEMRGQEFIQPCGQLNLPEDPWHIRGIEWKHMMEDSWKYKGSLITYETPFPPTNPDQYEYPFPDKVNRELFRQYKSRADAIPNLLMAGRLGENIYLDMDQAIARALMHAERILKK